MRRIPRRRVIDLHCDTIWECQKQGVGLVNDQLHYSLDRIPREICLCQCFAAFIPDKLRGRAAREHFELLYRVFCHQTTWYQQQISVIRDTAMIAEALCFTRHTAILTVEGGAALAGDLDYLDTMARYGVKMMTLTWNGANDIAGGCKSDQGFTPFGRQVVARMEQLGMAVDVSHLNDKGFYQLCEFAQQPFVASHSNARAVCPNPRNLTDDMFREIVRRGGLVGMNFYTAFISDTDEYISIDGLLRHIHHFLELGGEDTLALGSDFDGAGLPEDLNGVQALSNLIEAMERSGIPPAVVDKILFQNARRYFADVIGGPCK